MDKSFPVNRNFIIVSAALLVAVIFGYFLAQFLGGAADWAGLGILVLVLGLPFIPVLVRWHQPILIFAWNATLSLYFLPGSPSLWMLMAGCSLLIAVLSRATDSKRRFVGALSVVLPLLFLTGVVLATARLTGGMGMRVLGGQTFGGRSYVFIIAAVVGYFALTSQAIPVERAGRYIALFFLPGLLTVMSNVTYALGPKFYFFYFLFPPEFAMAQAQADYGLATQDMVRLGGMSWAGQVVFCFLLARYGISGVLEFSKPWRIVLLVLAVFGSMFGGFRSGLILLGLTFVALFCLEGVWRTRLLPILLSALVIGAAALLLFVEKMPLAVQRTLSFLPVNVDPLVRMDARGSTEWRVEMWRVLVPEIPKYLLKGKGYAINPTDLYLASLGAAQGLGASSEEAIVAGNYHNGPLSVIIPFGIFGSVCFLWFIAASMRALYLNYRHGDPRLKRINTFLLAIFVAWFVFFCGIFGGFHSDLHHFVGIVGLSIALNGGIRRPVSVPASETLQLAPTGVGGN